MESRAAVGRRRVWMGGAAVAMALGAVPAWASADEGGEADGTVAGVLVTGERIATRSLSATKTETAIAETPQSISVITAEQIQLRGALSVQDALLYSAGVRSDAYGLDGRVDSYNVRGSSAAQYLDGLRSTYAFYNTARIDPYALERIEVVKGPSSVIYGQGAVGGVVNLASKRPQFQRGGEFGVSYGSHNRVELRADVTGPIDVAGRLAFRVTAMGRAGDTQVDHIGDERFFIAPSITWRPTERIETTLLIHHQQDKTGSTTQFLPLQGTLLPNPNGRVPSRRFVGEPDFERYDARQTNVSLFTSVGLTDWATFRQNVRFSESEVRYQAMYPNSYANPLDPWVKPGQPGYTGPMRAIARSMSATYPDTFSWAVDNQLSGRFDTGPFNHRLLAGFDRQSYKQKVMQSGTKPAPPIDIYAPVYGNYPRLSVTRGATTIQEQRGVYLQDQVALGRLDLLLGVRRDKAESETRAPAGARTRKSDTATTYRVGALYTFANGFAPYVSYAESFLPVAGANLAGVPFDPQRGKQWEVGFKWTLPNAFVTGALYDLRDTNRVTTHPTNPLDRVQTGEVRVKGAELEAQARIAEVYDLTANYAYVDAEVSKSNNPLEIGKPFAAVPKHVVSAWGARRFDLADGSALRIGAGVRYIGPSIDRTAAVTPFVVRTPGYTLFDLMASYERDQWRAAINVNNVGDKYYYSTCLARGDCFIGARRSIVASLTRRF